MLRQVRLDSPGTFHHVIIHGIEKKDIYFSGYMITIRQAGKLGRDYPKIHHHQLGEFDGGFCH
jgi:hypothetical protein